MRCFISLRISEDVSKYLFNLQRTLRKELNAKIRWVPKSQLHITLKFLGSINNDKLKGTKERLELVKYNLFSLNLDKIGIFPSFNDPKILWVGINDKKHVLNLQKRIDEALLDIFPQEQRFNAHITFGRIKLIKDRKRFSDALNGVKIYNKTFEVNEFALIESMLKKDGPVYRTLNVYKLL